MSIDEKKEWIGLNLLAYKKPEVFLKLMRHYESASALINAGKNGFPDTILKNNNEIKLALSMIYGEYADKELEAISRRGISIITVEDSGYPESLRGISTPPPVLYCRGKLHSEVKGISVIGTRKPSEYGKMMAEKFSCQIADRRIAVISGMARGIDTIAHKSALRKNGYTIAVLGCGIDRVYPPENRKLYESICERGAVISEFPIGTPPHKMNFPRRNRIVSGISRATLVIEAGEKSGTLITVRFALEQGRDVFAIPGSIISSTSKGTNGLIKSGATLVDSFDDIENAMNDFFPSAQNREHPESRAVALKGDRDEISVLSRLDDTPRHIDIISKDCEIPMGRISSILMKLEITGAVKQVSGKMFMRNYV